MSDVLLTDCLACGAPAFEKQLTATDFQLKDSDRYVMDSRSGSNGTLVVAPTIDSVAKTEPVTPVMAVVSSDSVSPSTSTLAASGGCGTSYACH